MTTPVPATDPAALDLALRLGGVVSIRRRGDLVRLALVPGSPVLILDGDEADQVAATLQAGARLARGGEADPMLSTQQLTDAVRAIPGDSGWWRQGGEEAFHGLALQLLTKGFTFAETVEILSTAYGAVADEFGS